MAPTVLDLHHTGDEPHLLREIMRTYQAALNVFSRQVGMPAARLALMRFLVIRHPEPVGIMEIARTLKAGGVFCFDTINRTWLSNLVVIKISQDWGFTSWTQPNVHVWEKFIRPAELIAS